ncbi:MAG: hypothetical protein WCP22_03160 [Chlamydiota bacterium]
MEETRPGENRIEPQQPPQKAAAPVEPFPAKGNPQPPAPRPERRRAPRQESAAEAKKPRPPAAQKPNGLIPDISPADGGESSWSRLLIVILAVLALAELGAVIYYYSQFYSQTLVANSLQGKLDRSTAAAKAQSSEFVRQSDMLSGLKGEFVKVDEERRGLKKSIEERQKTFTVMEGRLKEALESAAAAKANLARQEQIAVYLRTRLKESKGTELQLMDRLESAAREKAALSTKLVRAREGDLEPETPPGGDEIPLKETVVTEAAATPNEIAGQVLVSHDKYNFVIVNLGSEDGIAVGNVGVIEQKGVEVGKAKVKKLYPRMCLADVVSASPDGKVEKNFVVKFSRAPRGGGT